MSNYKVSVIIPNYNHGRFLVQRIESVLNQSFQDFELIILDDCSTDDSFAIIEKYRSHPRISTLILNETNSGSTFKQWNKGIEVAKGKYIWIAESDDFASKDFLAEMVNRLEADHQVGVAYCQSWLVDQDGKVHDTFTNTNYPVEQRKRWESDYVNKGDEECVQFFIHKNCIPNASAAVFRKAIFEQAGGADEHFRINGDWFMWIKLLQYSDIAYIAKPMNYYRFHSQNVRSMTFSEGLGVEEYFKVMQFIYEHFTLPASIVNSFKYTLIHRWISAIIDPEFKIPMHRHKSIYSIVSKIDVNVNWHLLKSVAFLLKESVKNQFITKRSRRMPLIGY